MSDHNSVIINGQLVSADQAHISVQDRGFRYGDGVFETIALHEGVPYQIEWHLQRMALGLKELGIHFKSNTLIGDIKALLKANNAKNGTLRLQVTRGVGGKGYMPAQGITATCVVETMDRSPSPAPGIGLLVSTWRKPSPEALPVRYKLCQGMNSTLARMGAARLGCFDALLLSHDGMVAETSSANLFWAEGSALYTPNLATGALMGSTRAAICRLVPDIIEVAAPLERVLAADEIFITNSQWQVLSIEHIQPQGIKLGQPREAPRMLNLLRADIAQYCRDNHDLWA